jgi:tRNA A37 threonylcarbamoyladenosine synthetase subunit TsaC/SUA5/YrdC
VGSKELKAMVFLTQTDTTIGFVSQNADMLTKIKQRPPYKHYIKALPSLQVLKTFTRVPNRYKNNVRRAKRSTFIFPNGHSYRIIRETEHLQLIQKLGWDYTTYANISGDPYDRTFSESVADIIVGFPTKNSRQIASQIVKLNNSRMKRVR